MVEFCSRYFMSVVHGITGSFTFAQLIASRYLLQYMQKFTQIKFSLVKTESLHGCTCIRLLTYSSALHPLYISFHEFNIILHAG